MIKRCKQCSSKFDQEVSWMEFCSEDCAAKWKAYESRTKCKYCRAAVPPKVEGVEGWKGHFCSKDHFYEWIFEDNDRINGEIYKLEDKLSDKKDKYED